MFLGEHWGYLLIGIEHMSAELMAQCSRIWGLGFGSLCVVCPCGCECVCVWVCVCVCLHVCLRVHVSCSNSDPLYEILVPAVHKGLNFGLRP